MESGRASLHEQFHEQTEPNQSQLEEGNDLELSAYDLEKVAILYD
jgi:hypothetical protein